MSRQRFTEEFKIEAVKQVTKGHPVTEIAARLGVSGFPEPDGWLEFPGRFNHVSWQQASG